MYIIIHKYQRWSVNGKTKQKYLKKICQRRNKQTKQKTYQNTVCWSGRPKTISVQEFVFR